MSFREIFIFEIWYQFRRPSTWIFLLAITGLNFMVIEDLSGQVRSVENQLLTAPMLIAQYAAYTNNFGLLLMAALAGDGAMRDINSRIDSLIYTTPVSKATYLGGRLLGTATLAALLIMISGWLSLWIASYSATIDPQVLGPLIPSAYLRSALFITLPNVFLSVAIIYSIVLLSRQAMAAYLGALLIVILSTFSMELAGNNRDVGRMLDPSGANILDAIGRTLTPENMNTRPLLLSGSLLANRAVWLGVSLLVTTLVFLRFRLSYHAPGGLIRRTRLTAEESAQPKITAIKIPKVSRAFDLNARLYQVRNLAWSLYLEFLKSPVVLILPVIAIYAFILIPNISAGPMMVPILPTTNRISFFLGHSALQIILVLPISFFAGQLIWRERDSRINGISDAAPVSNAVMILSKYAGLVMIVVTIQLTLLIAGMAVQVSRGYYQFELLTYLWQLFAVQLAGHLVIAAVAVFFHVLINQKYVAHLFIFIFCLYTAVPRRFGVEHKLLIVNSDTGLSDSVFYDQSAFIPAWLLFKIYWLLWAGVLIIAAKHLWIRGKETRPSRRMAEAWQGLRASRILKVFLLLLVCAGGLIFYHTNIGNEYITRKERTNAQIEYERLYSRYKNVLQPYHTATNLDIELYPKEREAVIKGFYELKNGGKAGIDSIHITLAPEVSTSGIRFNRKARVLLSDKKHGYLICVLEEPLLPDELLQMTFNVHYKPAGFTNAGVATAVINNGSYFSNSDWFPAIGYLESREITDAGVREDNGLAKRPPVLNPDQNPEALVDRRGLEQITFEARIGTSTEQIALAPGSLKRTWLQNGRRYVQYVSDKPIRNAYHIYSADYAVRNSHWKSTELSIFHHPASVLNLEPIERAMKASLEYYSTNFSPYEFSQLRMVEYPDPGTGGISLPGSIAYSTNFALLDTKNDDRGFDLPFAVTAHEIAHQWWPHQLTPAPVSGKALITESLAWYSALGVVEHTYGPEHLRKLLDAMRSAYLAPMTRAGVPLLESTDSFDAYRRGPFAMYALREYIGEDQMNLALRNLVGRFGSGEPPYATSRDLYHEIKAVTPDSLHYLLKDLFERNTFWDLAAKHAGVRKAGKGNWQLTIDLTAKKTEVDPAGTERVLPMNDLIEIGIFAAGRNGKQMSLYLKKHRIRSGTNRLIINVPAEPDEAGIDPRHLLVDTDMGDNTIRVSISNK